MENMVIAFLSRSPLSYLYRNSYSKIAQLGIKPGSRSLMHDLKHIISLNRDGHIFLPEGNVNLK